MTIHSATMAAKVESEQSGTPPSYVTMQACHQSQFTCCHDDVALMFQKGSSALIPILFHFPFQKFYVLVAQPENEPPGFALPL